MIDPLFGFGFNSVWSLITLVVADGLCPVIGYSTLAYLLVSHSKQRSIHLPQDIEG
jgi:hypothetical protein